MSTEGPPLMTEGVVEDEDDVQVSRKVINYEPSPHLGVSSKGLL